MNINPNTSFNTLMPLNTSSENLPTKTSASKVNPVNTWQEIQNALKVKFTQLKYLLRIEIQQRHLTLL